MRKNKQLYNSLMQTIAKEVKRALNESDEFETSDITEYDEDIEEREIWVPSLGKTCIIKPCYDADSSEDFYSVVDENGEYVCEIHDNIDLSDDEDILADIIEDCIDWESGDGEYENIEPLGYNDEEDSFDLEEYPDYEDDSEVDEYFLDEHDIKFAYRISLLNGETVYDSKDFDEIFESEEEAEEACYEELSTMTDENDDFCFGEGDYRTYIYKIKENELI